MKTPKFSDWSVMACRAQRRFLKCDPTTEESQRWLDLYSYCLRRIQRKEIDLDRKLRAVEELLADLTPPESHWIEEGKTT